MIISWSHLPTWSRGVRRRMAAALASATLLASMGVAPAVHAATPFVIGDVMAAVGDGSVKQFDPTGSLKNTLVGTPSTFTAGMAFDSAGNLYVTDFFSGSVDKYDTNGTFLGAFITGLTGNPESLSFDSAGNLYVGQADGTGDVLKFDSSGAPLGSFDVATENRGSDWIDLAGDQCTLFYTSEGVLIKRFNVCTNTQLSDFATLPSGEAYALRIRPNGEVIVAATSFAYRLDSSGTLLQTYTVPGASLLFGMNLDPDGTSFWTGDLNTGDINRVVIATGTVVTTFNSSPFTVLGGLAVVGELRAAIASISLTPADATNPVGSKHTVTAHLRDNNGPIANATILFSVTGANTASGSGTTDASGDAPFTYTGTNAGPDMITACYDKNTNGTCDVGELTATATKTWAGAGPPASLTLTPPTATNTAGDRHCVTATVTDADGTPTPGITVDFSVSGPNGPQIGSAVTNANGEAEFCYFGTVAGDETITATADGGSNPSDTAQKQWVAGPPATLTLAPKTATNVVDSEHCVTATVVDEFGNPVPNTTVTFTVSGSMSTSGTGTTDANGQATFCYTGPGLPGADVITATATGGTNPTDTAAKTWVIPANNEACKVTYGGRITAANADKATFGGNAQGSGPKGEQEYQDHGPAVNINVHSINVLAVTCSTDDTMASIFGKATINGAGSFDYRIDLKDPSAPGPDTYRIRLSNGYDSGEKPLTGGNVQIH